MSILDRHARTEYERRLQGVASDIDRLVALKVQEAHSIGASWYAEELKVIRAWLLATAAEAMENKNGAR